MTEKAATDKQIASLQRMADRAIKRSGDQLHGCIIPAWELRSLITRIEQERAMAGAFAASLDQCGTRCKEQQATIKQLDTCHVGGHCELWDEIERLKKCVPAEFLVTADALMDAAGEIQRLRAALEKIAKPGPMPKAPELHWEGQIARAALAKFEEMEKGDV